MTSYSNQAKKRLCEWCHDNPCITRSRRPDCNAHSNPNVFMHDIAICDEFPCPWRHSQLLTLSERSPFWKQRPGTDILFVVYITFHKPSLHTKSFTRNKPERLCQRRTSLFKTMLLFFCTRDPNQDTRAERPPCPSFIRWIVILQADWANRIGSVIVALIFLTRMTPLHNVADPCANEWVC